MLGHKFVLQSETKSCVGVGTASERVSGRCVGWTRIVIGHQGLANVWICPSQRCCELVSWTSRSTFGRTIFRGMISTIPFVTQMSRHTLISVRLVRLVTLTMKVHPHRVMLQ